MVDLANWGHTSVEDRLEKTDFLVRASSDEAFLLWEKWHKVLPWKQINPGSIVQVGSLDNRPINISVDWDEINGHLVCFYDGISQLVDWKMIEEWLEKHYTGTWDKGFRRVECDAANFHLCLDHITGGNIPSIKIVSTDKEKALLSAARDVVENLWGQGFEWVENLNNAIVLHYNEGKD